MSYAEIEAALLYSASPSREVLQALSELAVTDPDQAAPLLAIVELKVWGDDK